MSKIDLGHLPIGIYVDEMDPKKTVPATVSLVSRNFLLQGEPRSGKSVMLSALIVSILRAEPKVDLYIMSPKILDFMNFDDAATLISDPNDMLACLEDIYEIGNQRKQYCIDHRIKKIDESLFEEVRPIVIIFDEFAIISSFVDMDDKGRKVQVGAMILQQTTKIVAEMGFAAISTCLTSQRLDTNTISGQLRDLFSGNRCSFASQSAMSDSMIFGDMADQAPCHKITRDQVGCGYISVDGKTPRCFKGALATEADEIAAAQYYLSH